MTKAQKRQPRRYNHSEKKSQTENVERMPTLIPLKELSKRVLHNYIIPLTQALEHRLQRLEKSL